MELLEYETLHIINKNPGNTQIYADCIQNLLEGDAVLLIEAAVYASCDKTMALYFPKYIPLYTLKADVDARGISQRMSDEYSSIDDDEFVKLCCLYRKSISWF
jgi:tRNA 2-thiouridine synthesizing protein B